MFSPDCMTQKQRKTNEKWERKLKSFLHIKKWDKNSCLASDLCVSFFSFMFYSEESGRLRKNIVIEREKLQKNGQKMEQRNKNLKL